MKQRILRSIKYLLLLALAVFAAVIFIPRSYNVPTFQVRKGTQYWQLSTGSVIGYTLLHAKGNKKSTPVIYLHGGPGGCINNSIIDVMQPMADAGYDVYLYDQVGSGASSRLSDINDYTTERHVQDLEAIIHTIGAQQVILVGQSWGAILACLFTAAHANQVAKIIFTSPGPLYPVNASLANTKVPDSIHLQKPFYTNATGNIEANNIRTYAMNFFAVHFGIRLASEKEADAFATYLSQKVNRSTVCDTSAILSTSIGAGYYASVMTFENLLHVKDPRPALQHCDIPVLIMKGSCDNIAWGFTKEYLDIFQDHELNIIQDAGHFIWVEQPEIFSNDILAFLKKNS